MKYLLTRFEKQIEHLIAQTCQEDLGETRAINILPYDTKFRVISLASVSIMLGQDENEHQGLTRRINRGEGPQS